MKFVVDKNIPYVLDVFKELGDVKLVGTDIVTKDSVRNADVLVIRSETKVDKALLQGSSVKFVATATAGIDHLDTKYLDSRGIAYSNAPGCNSDSVKEYVVAALLNIAVARGFSLKGKTIGIIGVGNVGSKVGDVAISLGMNILLNDPPLARETADKRFVLLDNLMTADVITLHVPLTREGEDSTYHLFNSEMFSKLKEGTIFINTSRGGVVEIESLKQAIKNKKLSATVLDVWENEPSIDAELLSMVTIGTPHIAGYSLNGKIKGLMMVREAVCKYFGISSGWKSPLEYSIPISLTLPTSTQSKPVEEILHQLVKECYDISFDDKSLRQMLMLPLAERAKYFQKLRTEYRVRREFADAVVKFSKADTPFKAAIRLLGFQTGD